MQASRTATQQSVGAKSDSNARRGPTQKRSGSEHTISIAARDQLATAVDSFSIPPQLAEDISKALVVAQQKAQATNKLRAQEAKDALQQVEARNGRLIDLLLKKTITEDEYRLQADRLQKERIKAVETPNFGRSNIAI